MTLIHCDRDARVVVVWNFKTNSEHALLLYNNRTHGHKSIQWFCCGVLVLLINSCYFVMMPRLYDDHHYIVSVQHGLCVVMWWGDGGCGVGGGWVGLLVARKHRRHRVVCRKRATPPHDDRSPHQQQEATQTCWELPFTPLGVGSIHEDCLPSRKDCIGIITHF